MQGVGVSFGAGAHSAPPDFVFDEGAIAEKWAPPMIESPSQWPASAQSDARKRPVVDAEHRLLEATPPMLLSVVR